MKVSRSVALKITLSVSMICLYSLAALLGLVLMSVSAWQYAGYAANPNFYTTVYSSDIQVLLLLFLVSGLLLMAISVLGILTGVLFLFVRPNRCGGLLLGLLGTGLVVVLTLETIAVTVQWEHWEEQALVLPGILETRTKAAQFSSGDWFGEQLSWFQDTFGCCGYNDGADYVNGTGAAYAVAQATANPNTGTPTLVDWRPRSCCDDFTVRRYDCKEQVASYNGFGQIGTEGCGGIWFQYLSRIQWALVGLSMAAGLLEIALAQIPLWFLFYWVVSARKEGHLEDEEEE